MFYFTIFPTTKNLIEGASGERDDSGDNLHG